jgi:hypothetical protein
MVMPSAKAQTVDLAARCAEQVVDRTMQTASITREIGTAQKLYVVLKKTHRLPRDITVAHPLAAAERLAVELEP